MNRRKECGDAQSSNDNLYGRFKMGTRQPANYKNEECGTESQLFVLGRNQEEDKWQQQQQQPREFAARTKPNETYSVHAFDPHPKDLDEEQHEYRGKDQVLCSHEIE